MLDASGVDEKAPIDYGRCFWKAGNCDGAHCIRLVNRIGIDGIRVKKVEMALWKLVPPEEAVIFAIVSCSTGGMSVQLGQSRIVISVVLQIYAIRFFNVPNCYMEPFI